MKTQDLRQIIKIRAAVGALGEKERHGWWLSSFFGSSASAFLNPVFPRTLLLSQVQGVTQAAMKVHDERIGVGQRVFHLFRLPEDLEQAFHTALHDPEFVDEVQTLLKSPDAALADLSTAEAPDSKTLSGPLHVGPVSSLRKVKPWQQVAGIYQKALQSGEQAFPYYSDLK